MEAGREPGGTAKLAHHDNDLALAGLVFYEPAIDEVLAVVCRLGECPRHHSGAREAGEKGDTTYRFRLWSLIYNTGLLS